MSYTRCAELTPLVDGAAVAAQARVELAHTYRVMELDDARSAQHELAVHVCGTSARLSHSLPRGGAEERLIDLTAIPGDARVRVLALVLGELGRTPPEPVSAPATPTTQHAASLSASQRADALDAALEAPTLPEPRYRQQLTFDLLMFTSPVSFAFGPRSTFAVARWELGLEAAFTSTSRAGTALLMGVTAASLGYTVLRSGEPTDDIRFDLTPGAALGVTWSHAEAGSETQGASATPVHDANDVGVWVAACVRGGLTVALTPPILARFGGVAGVATGLQGKVGGSTERTTSGLFLGVSLGIGWER